MITFGVLEAIDAKNPGVTVNVWDTAVLLALKLASPP